jgi:hypothetical protein
MKRLAGPTTGRIDAMNRRKVPEIPRTSHELYYHTVFCCAVLLVLERSFMKLCHLQCLSHFDSAMNGCAGLLRHSI